MSIVYLKVKIKSLAEEARIIRKEETKAKRTYRWLMDHQADSSEKDIAANLIAGLHGHRRIPVGTESRAALIAYGYLRGRVYSHIEQPTRPFKKAKITDEGVGTNYVDNILHRAYTLANKYGHKPVSFQEFDTWLND